MRNKRQRTQYPEVKHDPMESDPNIQVYLKLADAEAHAELAAEGFKKGFGYGSVFDLAKQRILKQKYQIEWKTLQEMNPGWTFD